MGRCLMVKPKPKHKRRGRGANVEGSLPLARRKLGEAIEDLSRGQRHSLKLDGGKIKRVRTLSLYRELEQAVAAHRGGGGGKWSGQFPFWADALVLLDEIDREVMKMHPAPHQWFGWTVERLAALELRRWRPQDCALIYEYVNKLESFVKRAEGLFSTRPIALPDPCPECGEKYAWRTQDEEEVRNAALQITEDGATCGVCKANWPVERLPMLGRILGYGVTPGVSESEGTMS